MTRLLDLHVHPSLKLFYLPYLNNSFHAKVYSGKHWNPLSFRTRYDNLKQSPEKVMLCAHYVIEQGFVAEGIRWFGRALSWAAAPWFYGPLRMAKPWPTLLKHMDTLEKSIVNSNKRVPEDGIRFKLIRSFGELSGLADNEIGIVHAIEGAHCFGYKPDKGQSIQEFWEQTSERLEYLKARGVCLITLAHFWDNMFCPQTDGTEIVPKKRGGKIVATKDNLIFEMKRAGWQWGDPEKLAEPFTRKLFEMGIIPDLSHSQEHARWKVYELAAEYKRPVVLSHVGLKHFFDHEYNLSDDEIHRIHKLGGIIGLILSRRWLVDPLKRDGVQGKGIEDLVENMLYIKKLVGDVSCIGIGTDFDGLTDPFKDCHTPDKLEGIARAMEGKFSAKEIDDILFGNGLRVLERGWGA